MHTELSVGQQLVRVRSISDDETTLYLELRNGLIATADNDGSLDLDVGDILLFDQTRDWITKAPSNLWSASVTLGRLELRKNIQSTASAYALVATAAYRRLSRHAPFVKT